MAGPDPAISRGTVLAEMAGSGPAMTLEYVNLSADWYYAVRVISGHDVEMPSVTTRHLGPLASRDSTDRRPARRLSSVPFMEKAT